MGTALRQLRLIQIGKETISTHGTIVAATRQLLGQFDPDEQQDFYRSPYAANKRATTGGAGVILRKGYGLKAITELTADEFIWLMSLGVKGSLTPVTATGESTWTAAPDMTTGIPAVDSASVEVVDGDGTTNHLLASFGYGMCSDFDIHWAFNQVAMLSYSLFGRARQTLTPTTALTPYTTREELVTQLLTVSIDAVGGTIGTTPITGIVRDVKFAYNTGLAPNYGMEGRTDRDMNKHKVSGPSAKLSLLLELDATATSQLTRYRANTNVLVRLANTGSTITSNPRKVVVDGAYRWLSFKPNFDGDQVLVQCELEAVYDATYTKMVEFVSVTPQATLA